MDHIDTHRIPERKPVVAGRRPVLTVVRLDRDDWDLPDTVAPLLGSICGIDFEAERAVVALAA